MFIAVAFCKVHLPLGKSRRDKVSMGKRDAMTAALEVAVATNGAETNDHIIKVPAEKKIKL